VRRTGTKLRRPVPFPGFTRSRLAEHAVSAGHDVTLANSRGPDSLTEFVDRLNGTTTSPHARAGSVTEAAVSAVAASTSPDRPRTPPIRRRTLCPNACPAAEPNDRTQAAKSRFTGSDRG